ncbi:tir domain tetratricopeptide repeat aaa atpase domain [Diplodia corticola]|uniref:Tir domain tetratricopeptide repeat aaa atpase domain n=1 Tax=Diplodia corticola TaxID=236234 RepID=A0A1J9QV69_9PEZI|nr:tir domain tetratricopeptide repeat aaa atpase domain [Diplodia corticola]OJD32289.1 tir domain tetratricopeptide repeat aaa atpase domain [Diplodia corticola]
MDINSFMSGFNGSTWDSQFQQLPQPSSSSTSRYQPNEYALDGRSANHGFRPIQSYGPPSNMARHVSPMQHTGRAQSLVFGHIGAHAIPSVPLFQEMSEETTFTAPVQQSAPPGRGATQPLDWTANKALIEKYYLEENNDLKTTKQLMEGHNFSATERQYKEKFNEWGFHKYIPNNVARYMEAKLDKRKSEGQRTVIRMSGQRVEEAQVRKAAQRGKKRLRGQADDIIVTTPSWFDISTPSNPSDSPHETFTVQSAILSPSEWHRQPTGIERSQRRPAPTLTETGGDQYYTIREEAERLDRQGRVEEAQIKYQRALDGFKRTLPRMHDDTVSLAYDLARFYHKHSQFGEATSVLHWLNKSAAEAWGLGDVRFTKHMDEVVSLLEHSDRAADAVQLVERLAATISTEEIRPASALSEPTEVRSAEYNLLLTRVQVKARHPEAESNLRKLIQQCSQVLERLPGQSLRAQSTLIELYFSVGSERRQAEELDNAERKFWVIARLNCTWSKPLCHAALELVSKHIAAARYKSAEMMHNKIAANAEKAFGECGEETIQLLIDIGIQYQKSHAWHYAKPFFQQAWSACMSAYGVNDERSLKLEKSLEKPAL